MTGVAARANRIAQLLTSAEPCRIIRASGRRSRRDDEGEHLGPGLRPVRTSEDVEAGGGEAGLGVSGSVTRQARAAEAVGSVGNSSASGSDALSRPPHRRSR